MCELMNTRYEFEILHNDNSHEYVFKRLKSYAGGFR